MELSRHDIGTCEGRYGRRDQRRRAGRRLCSDARARAAARLWSCTEKRALVDLASAAGSSVPEVAEAFGVAPSQLYAWRKQMAGGELEADRAMATFARIEVNDLPEVERPVADCPDPAGRIVVALSERRAIADRWDHRSDGGSARTIRSGPLP